MRPLLAARSRSSVTSLENGLLRALDNLDWAGEESAVKGNSLKIRKQTGASQELNVVTGDTTTP